MESVPGRLVMIPVLDFSSVDAETLELAPVVKLVYVCLALALKDRAAEMTFEPREDGCRLTYRVDGIEYEMMSPPSFLGPNIGQVFKVIAELDICKHGIAQSGRVRIEASSGDADLLVSIRPTPHGEAVHVSVESNFIAEAELSEVLGRCAGRTNRENRSSSWLQRMRAVLGKLCRIG